MQKGFLSELKVSHIKWYKKKREVIMNLNAKGLNKKLNLSARNGGSRITYIDKLGILSGSY